MLSGDAGASAQQTVTNEIDCVWPEKYASRHWDEEAERSSRHQRLKSIAMRKKC